MPKAVYRSGFREKQNWGQPPCIWRCYEGIVIVSPQQTIQFQNNDNNSQKL